MIPIFTKLALVTCAFYIGLAILLDATWMIAARVSGYGIAISISRSWWAGLFVIFWLISFGLAWHILIAPMLGGLSGGVSISN
jgi:hypothetical protein